MKKLVEFAEKYVEWVALGLGAMFLLAMAWMYLLTSPVSAEVDKPPKTVTPHNVERIINEDVASPLQQQITGPGADVSFRVAEFSKQFRDALQLQGAAPATIAANFWIGPGRRDSGPDEKKPTPGETGTAQGTIKGVPGPLPAAVWNTSSLGRSVIKVEAPVVGGLEGALAPAVPAPDGAVADPAKAGTESMWVTHAFTISASEISKSFRSAGVPENLTTAFLHFELIREEQQPDGKWGNRKVVPPLAVHRVRALPPTGDITAETEYLDWAIANAQTLAMPSFHMVVAGDQWYAPGQPNPNRPAVSTMRPVQPPRPTDAPPRPPRRGGRTYQAPDAPRPDLSSVMLAQALSDEMPPDYHPPLDRPQQPGVMVVPVAVAAVAVPKGFTMPTGNFAPGAMKEDFYVWAHDDSVQPDHTYRYKLRYHLKNPLFRYNTPDPKVARQFSIASAEGEWSQPVYVPPTVYIFLAGGFMTSGGQAKFDTLRWQDGVWTKRTFTASPGDQVGNSDGSDNTGWTLVDTRLDLITREPKVILADAAGNLTVRSLRVDQSLIIQTQKDIGYVEPARVVPGANPDGMPPGGF
jgi:hypothetical protein